MKKQTFSAVKLVAAAAAALMLTGCPTAQKAQQGQAQEQQQVEQQAQAQQQATIDTICVVRHQSESLAGDDLVRAIEAGLHSLGVKTQVVDHTQIPQECRLCLYYGVTAENGKAKTFDFQAVIDGRALQRGSGAIPENGTIELKTVAGYAAGYLQGLVNAGKANQAAEPAKQ